MQQLAIFILVWIGIGFNTLLWLEKIWTEGKNNMNLGFGLVSSFVRILYVVIWPVLMFTYFIVGQKPRP
jgi:hypothetical protein